MKNKLFSICLSIIMVITLMPSMVFAAACDETPTLYTNEATVLYSNEAPTLPSDEGAVLYSVANYYKFFKTSETISNTDATLQKVSADVIGPGTIKAEFSKTISASYSSTLASNNAGLIKATISASYGTSLTTTIGYTLNILAGKKGYMAFQPYTVIVKGNLNYYNSLYPNTPLSSTLVTAKYPKKLANGFADGLFYIKYI